MFPYFTLFNHQIYLQGIWIILATLIFIYWVYRYSKKNNIKFNVFLWFLPFLIIIPYFLWRYFYDFLTYKFLFPTNIFSLLSPYDYNFEFIWVSFWIAFVIFFFILSLNYKQEKLKYIDIFFYSITLALVIIWPFLLLWDNFYWNTTNSIIWVTPLVQTTKIPYIDVKRYPVWIFISLLWLILYLSWKILHFIFKKAWVNLYLIPFLFLWFFYIYHFVDYPHHFLSLFDIKLLYCLLMAIFYPIFLYLITRKNK